MFTDKVIDYISWTLLVVSTLVLGVAGNSVDNIIGSKKFILEFTIAGLIIASAWIYIFYRLRKTYFEGGPSRASAILGQFFSIIVLTIFISAYYNYSTGKNKVKIKQGVLADKSMNTLHHTTYAFIKIENKVERFNPKIEEWKKMQVGDTLLLTVGRGSLNYDYIYKFLSYNEK